MTESHFNYEFLQSGVRTAFQMPRNKVLLAFPKGLQIKSDILSSIFPSSKDIDCSVVRGVVWETKYYSVSIDLYVDEFDDLEKWLADLRGDDCIELRQALAGLIITLPIQDGLPKKSLNSYIEEIGQQDDYFTILMNLESTQDNTSWEEEKDEFALSGVELIGYLEEGLNEFGERLGIGRIREILDTHDWQEIHTSEDYTTYEITKSSEEGCDDLDLAKIIKKLEAAKLKYSTMKTEEEAKAFAQDIADELSEYF
ncbi:LAFE_0F17392g1_1 [Lachancea fermentati]|uniref:Increased recombination centers protein 6 n=1 Tax=Lachancea fermentati TaxID=4955 RepID=A0A1G4MGB7_LACFM|nr:LAFE_0F17392g1_1 [Lachancea fermentati]